MTGRMTGRMTPGSPANRGGPRGRNSGVARKA